MDRICEYQSHITKDTLEWKENLLRAAEETSDLMPLTVNMGSMRQYTTTLAAYFARARHIGGVERFLDENLRSKSNRLARLPIEYDEWQLKSQAIVNRINDSEHRSLLGKRYDHKIAETLTNDGVYYLKEEDYLHNSLMGFVLDGRLSPV